MIKVLSLEIENFRSVVGRPLRLEFDDLTTIVGPNNCGKSNILRALQLFFEGHVEGHRYSTDRDYPKSDGITPKAQTKITVEVQYDPTKEVVIHRALDELEKKTEQDRLDGNRVRLRLSYSKNGVESWQFFGRKGARNIRRDLIAGVRDALRRSIIFKYIPVGRDSLESITNEISSELIKTIFSGWSGAVRKRQEINEAISELLNRLSPELKTSSGAVTDEIRHVFAEIEQLDLQLPFGNLEEMLPSLTPVIRDTAETGLKGKGAGIQTSTLLFLLKYLADNHPQRHNARVTFVWAVEEPESFLHPTKQKSMADMLRGFSAEVQTLVTTHCAHFVPRSTSGVATYVVDKDVDQPWSTVIVGDDYDLARQTLGVTLLDSMTLYPLNVVVEGPSDEIYFGEALRQVDRVAGLDFTDVKFFPGGNAASATYLFEWISNFCDHSTVVKLVIDGDEAGRKALKGLLGRGRRDGVARNANQDYFQIPTDVENLLSDRVKRQLKVERPSQVELSEDISGKITSFAVKENKRANARRAMEISELDDLKGFQTLFERIAKSM